jgi:hypothetical protein
MGLLQKQKKHHPKHITKLGLLPKVKKFDGLRYTRQRVVTSSKVEANHKVAELKKKNKLARKVLTKDGWEIYSRKMNG